MILKVKSNIFSSQSSVESQMKMSLQNLRLTGGQIDIQKSTVDPLTLKNYMISSCVMIFRKTAKPLTTTHHGGQSGLVGG